MSILQPTSFETGSSAETRGQNSSWPKRIQYLGAAAIVLGFGGEVVAAAFGITAPGLIETAALAIPTGAVVALGGVAAEALTE